MAAKGLFTQGLAVLLSSTPALDEIERLLGQIAKTTRKPAAKDWEFGGPMVMLPYRPEANGFVSIDLVERPWPDGMGDPKKEPMLFGAWSMGFFGPGTFPQNLARAVQQSWHWPEAGQVVPHHRAFLRIRSTYSAGAGPHAKVFPEDYASVLELQFLTHVVQLLLDLPEAIAYFNPAGEMLMNRHLLLESLDHASKHSLLPLNVWSNVRLFNFNEDWLLMDTVGMTQLDLPDHEACFLKSAYEAAKVASFLRDVALYLLNNGEVIKDGDNINGPGGMRWRGRFFKNGICPAPRRVIRWFPCDGSSPPSALADVGNAI